MRDSRTAYKDEHARTYIYTSDLDTNERKCERTANAYSGYVDVEAKHLWFQFVRR